MSSFGNARPVDHAEAGHAEIDQLDLLLAGVVVAEGACRCAAWKAATRPSRNARVDRAGGRRHAHLHRLPGVAHVGLAHEPDARSARCRRAPASRPRRSRARHRCAATAARSMASSCITLVTMWSVRQSTASRPKADRLPGLGGTMQAFMPSRSMTAGDCAGPEPPNDSSANSRGSMPRWMVICRMAVGLVPVGDLDDAFGELLRSLMLPGSRAASAAMPRARAFDIERDAAADQRRRDAARAPDWRR